MQFLSDVYLRCPDCDGRRYRPEVLEVKWRAEGAGRGTPPRSIADVLEMTVDDAVALFAGHPEVMRSMEPLQAVGLGYLRLGQPVPTLSGGEAQRLKLAGNLVAGGNGGVGTLFLFDEPTTGLHFEDVAKLLQAFRRLLKAGHSLVVIEHNLDVIRAADWVIDLGPEGGDGGGEVVCLGTPEQVARHPLGHPVFTGNIGKNTVYIPVITSICTAVCVAWIQCFIIHYIFWIMFFQNVHKVSLLPSLFEGHAAKNNEIDLYRLRSFHHLLNCFSGICYIGDDRHKIDTAGNSCFF